MNILITGGAGFVGSHLCEKYANGENSVICLDNGFHDRLNGIESIQRVSGDISNEEIILGNPPLIELLECKEIDAIIHLAAQVNIGKAKDFPMKTWKINVDGTLNLLELARKNDIRKFLFASSSEVYGSALYLPIDENHPLGTTSIYGASKIAGDRLCHAYSETYGMDIGILRPFNIYGPGQRGIGVIPLFVEKILSGQPPIIQGDGSQTRDYIFIDDMISAYDAMLREKDTGAINFGTGVGTSVKEIANIVAVACNSDIRPVFEGKPANTTSKLVANITKAKIYLDWRPKCSIRDGIQKYVEWFREKES